MPARLDVRSTAWGERNEATRRDGPVLGDDASTWSRRLLPDNREQTSRAPGLIASPAAPHRIQGSERGQ